MAFGVAVTTLALAVVVMLALVAAVISALVVAGKRDWMCVLAVAAAESQHALGQMRQTLRWQLSLLA